MLTLLLTTAGPDPSERLDAGDRFVRAIRVYLALARHGGEPVHEDVLMDEAGLLDPAEMAEAISDLVGEDLVREVPG